VSTFGCFSGVWFILVDVSEPPVKYMWVFPINPWKLELSGGCETSANINQTPWKHPKVDTVNTKHGKILKPSDTSSLEDGPDRGFRNVDQYKPDAVETPKI
jgi:hypothetical protein